MTIETNDAFLALDLDDVAAALGVQVFRGRLVGILTVTLVAAAACGSIAFLGLMVPGWRAR
ncbi:iron chelate uptake ABC transporter family permease subunit [Nocardia sp. NPDC051052]|uniref:iron chelate uptake ABC transporter family permease subunit n=1 Tax=Nocardia sp. NPDC051052 TaxID=3364322 RepID=UPI0037B1C11A